MRDVFYLARRYLAAHPGKSAILVASLTLLLYLPSGLQVLVDQSARNIRERADTTPLLIGAKGSSLDLALRALYFEGELPAPIAYREATRVRASGLADPIPLHLRFRVGAHPVVGTSVDYFAFRGSRFDRGRAFALLGECVLGAAAAEALEVGVDGKVTTSPENLFDFAGSYPLRMRVVGVLAPTGGPDDQAVFTDVRTAWVVEGHAHGHEDPRPDEVLERDDAGVTANAKLKLWQEITSDNVASFHFHGDREELPVTAVLALPHDEKSKTLLLGRYLGREEACQILEPRAVMDELIATVVRVRGYILAVAFLLGTATLATVVLVFLLSLRLRRRELETMRKIGCSRGLIAGLVAAEAAVVLGVALLLAAGLVLFTARFADSLIRWLIV